MGVFGQIPIDTEENDRRNGHKTYDVGHFIFKVKCIRLKKIRTVKRESIISFMDFFSKSDQGKSAFSHARLIFFLGSPTV